MTPQQIIGMLVFAVILAGCIAWTGGGVRDSLRCRAYGVAALFVLMLLCESLALTVGVLAAVKAVYPGLFG